MAWNLIKIQLWDVASNRTFSQQKYLIEVISSFLALCLVKDLENSPIYYKRTFIFFFKKKHFTCMNIWTFHFPNNIWLWTKYLMKYKEEKRLWKILSERSICEIGFSFFCSASYLSPQWTYDVCPQPSLLIVCVECRYPSIVCKRVGGLVCRPWRCWYRPVPADLFTVKWKAGMTSPVLVALNLTQNLAALSTVLVWWPWKYTS